MAVSNGLRSAASSMYERPSSDTLTSHTTSNITSKSKHSIHESLRKVSPLNWNPNNLHEETLPFSPEQCRHNTSHASMNLPVLDFDADTLGMESTRLKLEDIPWNENFVSQALQTSPKGPSALPNVHSHSLANEAESTYGRPCLDLPKYEHRLKDMSNSLDQDSTTGIDLSTDCISSTPVAVASSTLHPRTGTSLDIPDLDPGYHPLAKERRSSDVSLMDLEVPVLNMLLSAGSSVDLDMEDNILSIDRMEDGTDFKALKRQAVPCDEISVESRMLHVFDQCSESNGRVPFGTPNGAHRPSDSDDQTEELLCEGSMISLISRGQDRNLGSSSSGVSVNYDGTQDQIEFEVWVRYNDTHPSPQRLTPRRPSDSVSRSSDRPSLPKPPASDEYNPGRAFNAARMPVMGSSISIPTILPL
ncbi:MAG: hypothetical protein M1824_001243 [Vezdaea acicularis]|nr:MAG: hypothetical protein M1824_001243 [Vezdaea acicularis]